VATHAIGDAAVAEALAAYADTGAIGSIEHAQLVGRDDVRRMAELGVRASVQPAHLLDDRDLTELAWPGRADRCFAFRWMLDEGVELALGSDAPVSPLDPWLAIAAAVHRSSDEREPWHAEQALTPAEALTASVDGQPTVGVGSPGDLVLLDADPLAPQGDSAAAAAALREMSVALTVVGGRVVHSTL
jgi:predicted amidohydrolase YtcJ